MLCKKALNAPLFQVMILRGGDVKRALGNYQDYSGEVPNGDYILKKANTVENTQAIESKQEIFVTEAMIEAVYNCFYNLYPLHEGLIDLKNGIRLTLQAGLREA